MSLEFVLSKQFERQQRLSNKIFKSALVGYALPTGKVT